MTIQNHVESKKLLAARLYRDFQALKTYGKEPESLNSIISLFNETLADYSFEEINAAMTQHVKKSPEFPTPYDVVELIKQARIEKAKRENEIIGGVDDTLEKIREYDEKKRNGVALKPKEYELLRRYGWKLICG